MFLIERMRFDCGEMLGEVTSLSGETGGVMFRSNTGLRRSLLQIAALAGLGQLLMVPHAPAAEQFYRLQLKHSGHYLDADHCSDTITLNPGSEWEGGACQLWRLVPAGGGWNRLQLKHGGKYLDADHCSDKIGLSPISDWEDGACQLWRLVPASGSTD